jgi:hypothetical protein
MMLRVSQQYAEVVNEGTGKLRVSAQSVEIVNNGTGKLRTSQQYVEILSSVAPYAYATNLEIPLIESLI